MTSVPFQTEKGGAFFLYGEDEFRKKEAAEGLVDLHLDASVKDFNFDHLRGDELDVEALASVLATPPMMAEWRVVLLTEAEALAQSSRARGVVLDAVADSPPGLAFIVSASIPKGSRARFYRDLKKLARSVEFAEISDNDVPGWLMERAREHHGVEMDEDAARALGASVGTDLGILAQEVAKLADMVEEGERISLVQVESGGARLPKGDRWSWLDMVGEKRFGEALETLPVVLAQRQESPVGLTIAMGRHLLRLGIGAAGGEGSLVDVLPPHVRGWLGSKLARQAEGWTLEEVEDALQGLRRVDRLLKASSLPQELILESFLLERMSGAAAVREGTAAVGARSGAVEP